MERKSAVLEKEEVHIVFCSFDLEDTNRQFPTQSITYTSYQNLFEEQYKDAFLSSIEVLDWKELHHTLGTGTLNTIMAQDATIQMHVEQITKERDKVKNATNKETQENYADNAEKNEKRFNRKSHAMEG
ncbi:hypothetical protein [Bacillus thuringiensis]|uniref:hypothetical protein n=1 Tax=Bacillus thuringiensis TaxID=1428 RepID=UPI0020D28A77|nr:hypothetical protein [Bacillus thuringiensis]